MSPIDLSKTLKMNKLLNYSSNRYQTNVGSPSLKYRPFNSESRNTYLPAPNGIFSTSKKVQKLDNTGNWHEKKD